MNIDKKVQKIMDGGCGLECPFFVAEWEQSGSCTVGPYAVPVSGLDGCEADREEIKKELEGLNGNS